MAGIKVFMRDWDQYLVGWCTLCNVKRRLVVRDFIGSIVLADAWNDIQMRNAGNGDPAKSQVGGAPSVRAVTMQR
jgi:hypothetical protein